VLTSKVFFAMIKKTIMLSFRATMIQIKKHADAIREKLAAPPGVEHAMVTKLINRRSMSEVVYRARYDTLSDAIIL